MQCQQCTCTYTSEPKLLSSFLCTVGVGDVCDLDAKTAQVRQTAASAVAYCAGHGGKVPKGDFVHKLSTLAACGKHPQNAERDLQFAIRTYAKTLGVSLREVNCRMWDPAANEIVQMPVSYIDPVSFATALWTRHREVFHKFFFGSMTETAVSAYWSNAAEHCDWFQKHRACSLPPEKWKRLAPLSLYGDDINTFRNTEAGAITIIAFTSDFAHGNSPFFRYSLLSLYAEYTACEFTYNDLMQDILERLMELCNGDHPWCKQDYGFILSACQGDLKWMNQHYGLHNYRANKCCSLCEVCKVHPAA